MKQIIVTIPKDGGPVVIQTSGFTGDACLKATAKLKAALGTTISETPNEEMFIPSAQLEGQSQ